MSERLNMNEVHVFNIANLNLHMLLVDGPEETYYKRGELRC